MTNCMYFCALRIEFWERYTIQFYVKVIVQRSILNASERGASCTQNMYLFIAHACKSGVSWIEKGKKKDHSVQYYLLSKLLYEYLTWIIVNKYLMLL